MTARRPKLYVNGALVASKPFAGNVGDSNMWRIGAYGATAGDFFDGLIDEVRIYDRALTAARSRTDMNTALVDPAAVVVASRPSAGRDRPARPARTSPRRSTRR